MKLRPLLIAASLLFGTASFVQAGGPGPGCGGPRGPIGFGGGWGGYCGPRFGWGPRWAPPVPIAVEVPVYPQVVVGRPVRVVPGPSSTLVMAQSQLARLGYYDGVVDGIFGPRTSRAIRQYQSDYGLAVTGRLDRATLQNLGS